MGTAQAFPVQENAAAFSGTQSALGTLLRFLGSALQRGDALMQDEGTLAAVMGLMPLWQDFAAQSQLPLPLEQLEAALREVCADAQARQRSRCEYNRLFHGPDLPVPLWESVWLSPEKILFTEETTAVRRWYRRFGLDIAAVGYEAEDHIGLEIAFCGWLYEAACQNEEAARKNVGHATGDSPLRAKAVPDTTMPNATEPEKTLPDFSALELFIGEHPGRWIPSCLSRLREASNDPFWQTLFTLGFVLMDSLSSSEK